MKRNAAIAAGITGIVAIAAVAIFMTRGTSRSALSLHVTRETDGAEFSVPLDSDLARASDQLGAGLKIERVLPSATVETPAEPKSAALRVRDVAGQELGEFSLDQLRGRPVINGVRISLTRQLKSAVVADQGGLQEGSPNPNPALELKLERGKESLREVAFARFPTFALQKDGAFGLRFEYVAPGASATGPVVVAAPPGQGKAAALIDGQWVVEGESKTFTTSAGNVQIALERAE